MNVNATRKWLIAFMLCVFIVRVTKTLQPLSLSSSPMKKKKTIQTTKKKTNNNYNNTKKGVAKTKSQQDVSSIETHALETKEEIRARVKVNAHVLGGSDVLFGLVVKLVLLKVEEILLFVTLFDSSSPSPV
ncbi:unnamed protein product [Bathycoccus prasinos]